MLAPLKKGSWWRASSPARPLDFDYLGAHVAQHLRAKRTGDEPRQVEDGHSVERGAHHRHHNFSAAPGSRSTPGLCPRSRPISTTMTRPTIRLKRDVENPGPCSRSVRVVATILSRFVTPFGIAQSPSSYRRNDG